ncbi:MAG: hypothetical protein AAFR93_00720, partial [Pseudomonadota bacterium]
LQGGWAEKNQRLGVLSVPQDPVLLAWLPPDTTLTLDQGTPLWARARHAPQCTAPSTLQTAALAAADALVKLTASVADDSCLLNHPHGTAILLRIERADASLLTRLTQAARRVLQARLPLERETPQ